MSLFLEYRRKREPLLVTIFRHYVYLHYSGFGSTRIVRHYLSTGYLVFNRRDFDRDHEKLSCSKHEGVETFRPLSVKDFFLTSRFETTFIATLTAFYQCLHACRLGIIACDFSAGFHPRHPNVLRPVPISRFYLYTDPAGFDRFLVCAH